MPFLHGFRRITLEYQPLVDEILALLALQDAERQNALESHACLGSNGSQLSAMRQVLEREAHSPFYQEGVSYTLLKVTELGLVEAAEVLLEFGADLGFEDPVTYYTPLHIAVLRNQADMVELLARHGADINRRDRIHESSPLDLASEEPERLPCLQRLLQLGADVNAADKTGKTALLHALLHCHCSSVVDLDDITESIRLLLEGGADARATTENGDTVFTYIIFLLGDIDLASTEVAEVQNSFCIRVMQLLMAHGANPSAAYNCSLHGPSCWSGFQTVFDCLCSDVSILKDSSISTEVIQMGQTLLELMMASSQTIQLPSDFEVDVNSCRYHEEKIRSLFCSVKQLEHTPQALKHLCRVFIRQRLRPWPIDVKIKALPLPDRLKWYLLIDHTAVGHEDLSLTDDSSSPHSVVTVPTDSQQITALHPLSLQ
uniref:Ankyrin repeat and SOCS box containing 6 n=1 Tax=Meleagris gallopavo TaxID=9103 RepID=G1N0G3_MELGA